MIKTFSLWNSGCKIAIGIAEHKTMDEPHLFSLPKELLAIIFNFVDTEQLLKLESTSKQWQKVSWDSVHDIAIGSNLKSPLNDTNLLKVLNKLNPQKIRKMNLIGEKDLTTSLTNLEKFNNIISFTCRSMKGPAIKSAVPYLTAVRKLDMSARELSDECIQLFANNMPHLTKLLICNSSEMRDLPDITRLTKLEILNLAFSEKTTNTGLAQICLMTHLQRLDICWLKNIDGEGFDKISNLTNLIHLDVSNIAGVRDSYFTALLALKNLELLDLSYYKILSDFGVSIIGQLTNMTKLVFVDNRSVTADGLWKLANLTKLNHLSFSSMPNMSNDHFISGLIHLTHLRTKIDDDFSVLGHLTDMKDLSIAAKNEINEEFFLYISVMAKLESLNLRASRCSVIFDTLTCCTNLTCLEIDDCANFFGPGNNADDDVIERVLKLTTLKNLELRFNRDFNRLAELKNLESLKVEVPARSKVRKEDFTQLLTLPHLVRLELTTPIPAPELKDVFNQYSQLTTLTIESNQNEAPEEEIPFPYDEF